MFEDEFEDSFEQDVTDLIAHFERMRKDNQQCFFEETSYEQIIDFYEGRSDYTQALEVADMAIAQYPFSAVFLVKKAQLYFDMKNYDHALYLLDQATLLDSTDINIHLLRSDIYVWQGNFRKASNTIKSALEFADVEEKSDLYLELADIYEEWERYHEVFEFLIESLKAQPDNEEALNRLWFCVEFTEKYEESILFHKQFINDKPFSALAWFNLAHAYSGLEMFEEAIDAFEYVLAIDDKHEFALKDCADAFFQLGKYREAINYYEESIQLSKPYKELYFNIGECYEHLRDYSKARHYFRKATGLDPNFEDAFYRLGMNYMAENKCYQALNPLLRAHRLNPEEADYIIELARCYRTLEENDQSLLMYERVIQVKDLQIAHWKEYAEFLVTLAMFRKAIDVMDEALDFFGHHAEIYWHRSIIFYMAGNKKEAFISLETALLQGLNFSTTGQLPQIRYEDPAVADLLDHYIRDFSKE